MFINTISSARVYIVAIYCDSLRWSSMHRSGLNLSFLTSLCRIIVWCVKSGLACAYICCALIALPLLAHLVFVHSKLWHCLWRAMQSVCTNRAWTVYCRCDCAQHSVSDSRTIRLCLHILRALLSSLPVDICEVLRLILLVHTYDSNSAYLVCMCTIVCCHDWLGRACAQVCCVPLFFKHSRVCS